MGSKIKPRSVSNSIAKIMGLTSMKPDFISVFPSRALATACVSKQQVLKSLVWYGARGHRIRYCDYFLLLFFYCYGVIIKPRKRLNRVAVESFPIETIYCFPKLLNSINIEHGKYCL